LKFSEKRLVRYFKTRKGNVGFPFRKPNTAFAMLTDGIAEPGKGAAVHSS
jgi:hypothetical protein